MKTRVSIVHNQIIVKSPLSGVTSLTSEEAFMLAEELCAAAFTLQGGPTADPDEREAQQQKREKRKATSFEELYCTLRGIAHDWHLEAVRRQAKQEKGAFNPKFCDAGEAVKDTFLTVLEAVKDWDY